MDDIRNILAHCDVEPSPNCWNKLSSQLDVLLPQQPTSASVAQTHTASSVGKGVLQTAWSTGTKVAVAVISTAAIATAVSLTAIHHNHSKEVPTTEITAQPATDIKTENIHSEVSVSLSDDTTSPISSTSPTEIAPIALEPAHETASVASKTTSSNAPQISATTPATHIEVPTQPIISSRPALPTTTAKPIIPSSTLTSVQQSVQNDPVLQMHANEEIDMTPPIKLEIPNVFTPNGDGINDYFVILGLEKCSKRQLVVRNHSGQIVYRSNSYDNLWDGNGCPDGVYNYQFFYINNGISQTITGTLHIIR